MIIKLIKTMTRKPINSIAGWSAAVSSYYEVPCFYINICNSQGRILASSEMYQTKQAAQKAIESFRRNGLKFKVKDLT